MSISELFQPDFAMDGVYPLLWDPAIVDIPESAVKAPAGYAAGNPVDKKSVATTPLSLLLVRREYYNVMSTGKPSKVGSFVVDVPIEHELQMTINRTLLYKNGISQAAHDAILAAFNTFDFALHGDPNAFAAIQMGGNGSPDEFEVAYTYSLRKISSQEHPEHRDALIRLYSGAGAGTIETMTGPSEIANVFRTQFRLILIKTEQIQGPAPATKPRDPQAQWEHETGKPTPNPEDVIREFITEQSESFLDCKVVASPPVIKRVAELLKWPEFKIEWEQKTIRIGCIQVVVTLPHLYTRTATVVLWAYVAKPANVVGTLLTIVETCTIRSAIYGAVIGIVFASWEGAVAAFQAVFERCIEINVGEYVQCLFPSLAMETEHSGWV